MSIHDRFFDAVSLATAYADDGAFRSSAKVLRELAETLETHAADCDQALADIINLQGSGPAPIEPREA